MLFNQRAIALLQLPVFPFTWDSILKECARLQEEFLHIPSEFKWALDFKRFEVERARGNHSLALRHLKSAISTAPYNNEILTDYRNLVSKTSEARNVVLVVSSKKNESKALRLADQLDRADIQYMIISGADTNSIKHVRALQVDSSDSHEAEPHKVVAALTWVYENVGSDTGVLKISDQMVVQDAQKLRQRLDQLATENVYAGVPVNAMSLDRCQHWGWCRDHDLNSRVYGRPVLRDWAHSAAYYLGPRPLEKVVLAFVRFPGLFEGEYYDDKLIGDTLVFENENLTEFASFADLGLAAEAQGAAAVQNVQSAPVSSAPAASLQIKAAASSDAASSAAKQAAPAAAPTPPKKRANTMKLSDWNNR